MTTEKYPQRDVKRPTTAKVVCFGSLMAMELFVIDEWPQRNFGCIYQEQRESLGLDAAMIAIMLRGWDIHSGLIGSALAEDYRGRWLAEQLKLADVLGEVRLDSQLSTIPVVLISDAMGGRTYFWQPDKKLMATLDTADLSVLNGSRLLYVDWYDEDHILRPMDEAIKLNIPVFLNLEHLHEDPDILARYAGRATICQAITDSAQRGDQSPLAVAQTLLDAGVKTALITLAGEGCLVVQEQKAIRVHAPSIQAIDSFGAGATFSAGFIYGYLKGWSLEKMARFATATASIKCSRVGLEPPDLIESQTLAEQLQVEYL
ncbi:carbohydrate kinase family protein [Coleofasciculus sp. G3-WIS-01]|uniref:carbohydrate kinase family protein n=1 Tax=Coleofasciculus sp. G3-WIS-01 TaxID=3069528 RepID=UPI004064A707